MLPPFVHDPIPRTAESKTCRARAAGNAMIRCSSMKLRLALITLLGALPLSPIFAASSDLTAYFVDVEGGQATLFVTPSGQSVLIDTGWLGFNDRDAERIG